MKIYDTRQKKKKKRTLYLYLQNKFKIEEKKNMTSDKNK